MAYGQWPNADDPGVPAFPMEAGFHWLTWTSGVVTIAQWDPDTWCWVLSYLGMVPPSKLAHLNYVERAHPPVR